MSPARISGTADLASPALLGALRRMLRPVVRLLLANHLTHPDFSTFMKSIFVEVAREELAAAQQRETASRISVLTGVHRKDLRRLMAQSPAEQSVPESVSLGARLVRRWTSEAPFLDRRGRPRPLPRHSDTADVPDFEQLVASISSDVRPRTVLDEWLRIGIVEIDAKDRIRLRVAGFVPTDGFEEKAHFFGRNLHDHISAAAQNLAGDGPAMLERSVNMGGLSQSSVDELAALSEKLGMAALREVNRRALRLSKRDEPSRDANSADAPAARINFGVYFFHEADAPEKGSS